MKNKKGTLPLVANLIIGLVILGAGTMFVTSDIGQPLFEFLTNYAFPELTPGCDTNSIRSIQALAYALNCVGMSHAGVDVTELCPAQKEFGTKVAVCYGEDENYNCEVQGFELTKDPEYDESDPEGWITGMGDPNCLVYYEAFPEDQAADWKVRVEDFSWGGVMLGGALNMIPGAKQITNAGWKGIKVSMKTIVNTMTDPQFILKALKVPGKLYGKMVLEKKILSHGIKNADGIIRYVFYGAEDAIEDEIREELTKDLILDSQEYLMKNTKFDGKEFEKTLITKMEQKYPTLHKLQREVIAKNYRNSLEYVVSESKGDALIKLQNLRRLNIYDDFMFGGLASGGWTQKMMTEEIEKSLKIYNNLAKSQKEIILSDAKRLSEFYMQAKPLEQGIFQLWAIDLVTENIPESVLSEDNAEAVNAFSTCGVMLGIKSKGTLLCAFVTSVGISAAYIDNDNEKYNPVGINALGYKSNYYNVQTEQLEDIINYYYIALSRDEPQRPTRFFLASPCKTEKVIVKHEKMGCYVTECKNDLVCCNKTTEVNYNSMGVERELTWTTKDNCMAFPDYYDPNAPNSGTQNGYLFGNPNGDSTVLYTENTANADGTITFPDTGLQLGLVGPTGYQIDLNLGDQIVSDNKCIDEGLEVSAGGRCQGAYYNIDTPYDPKEEYYYLTHPQITTLGRYEGADTKYKPDESSSWSSTVEINSAADYYNGATEKEIDGTEYYVQFNSAQVHNSEIVDTGNSYVEIPTLYMDADGNGIKQCEPYNLNNLWKTEVNTDINALKVYVEFDNSFEGTNYCYAGVDWLGGSIKTSAMLAGVAIDIVASAALTTSVVGVVLIPTVNFITGASYEIVAHYVDKWNAWPNR